jgi:hypothetical protein
MKLSFDVLAYSIVPLVPLQNKRGMTAWRSLHKLIAGERTPSLSIILTQGISDVVPVPNSKAGFLARKCLSRLDSRQV